MPTPPDGEATRVSLVRLSCPRCRLSLTTRCASLPVRYCPRCLARRHAAVALDVGADPIGAAWSVAATNRRARSELGCS